MAASGSDTAPEAGAPEDAEVTVEMIEAGETAFFATAVYGWDFPDSRTLKAVLVAVYVAMSKSASKPRPHSENGL